MILAQSNKYIAILTNNEACLITVLSRSYHGLITVLFIVAIRIAMLFIFKSGFFNTEIMWNDQFHHYQLGIVLLLILIVLHHAISFSYNFLFSFALALIIEEYSVLLYDLGLNKGSIYYLGWIDTLILLGLCIAIVTIQLTVLK